ncbi:MAG: DUF2793 domain-containing protein [Fulvimarina manganoxydans]|uniref:DUF2793 domain-containing protein n=1 Tax=Fulvimarina manganoxydans TaxID=937218 RepID=UPI002356C714|nr:DUF2793 domain-containing protein [Fulvimarina manganoxydans]MCK5931911.1 DUF2793 domain-containing protein [Fulvimarina manganoxydans]
MSETANLALPYILAAQAQKHLTHNEALRALDAIVHLSVLDLDRTEPPAEPQEGDRHIVAAPAGGEWVGRGAQIAAFQDGAWAFFTPRAGWLAHVAGDGRLRRYDGERWVKAVSNAPIFGVNAVGDNYNRLVVKTSSALFSHDDVSGGGNGSVLGSFNRQDASKDAAFNFQTAYQTNALFGLLGGDSLSIKVSGDGSAFATVLEAASANGIARLPSVPKAVASTNYDNYIAADAWTAVALNDTASNAQGAFDAGANVFTAPVAGLYFFAAALGWHQNGANVPTRLSGRLVSGSTILAGPFSTSDLTEGEATLVFTMAVPLAAGDEVKLEARLSAVDGYLARDVTRLSAFLLA